MLTLQNKEGTPEKSSKQRGATSIEYALVASLISVVIIGSATAVGDSNKSIWTNVVEKITAALG